MRRYSSLILAILCIVSFYGCDTLMNSRWNAIDHARNIGSLKAQMSPEDVSTIMGAADKTQTYKTKDGDIFLIYYYVTEGAEAFSYRLTEKNYTPLVFKNKDLIGKGWGYLKEKAKENNFSLIKIL
jgi:hypothetical protein